MGIIGHFLYKFRLPDGYDKDEFDDDYEEDDYEEDDYKDEEDDERPGRSFFSRLKGRRRSYDDYDEDDYDEDDYDEDDETDYSERIRPVRSLSSARSDLRRNNEQKDRYRFEPYDSRSFDTNRASRFYDASQEHSRSSANAASSKSTAKTTDSFYSRPSSVKRKEDEPRRRSAASSYRSEEFDLRDNARSGSSYRYSESYHDAETARKPTRSGRRGDRSSSSRRRSVRNDLDFKLHAITPDSFDCCEEISNRVRVGETVIINLDRLDASTSRRIVDFTCGVAAALDAEIRSVSNSILLLAPEGTPLTGDILAVAMKTGEPSRWAIPK